MTASRERHDGAATVLAIGLVAVLVLVAVVSVGTVAIVLAHRRAQAAADLAALAAASALQRGGDACAAAATIAGRHDARLADCVVDGDTVGVVTEVAGVLGTLPARARAGPSPSG